MLALLIVLVSPARAATGRQLVTVYTVASGVQFINTADDRARGYRNNAFNAATQKLAPKVSARGKGPQPGDTVLYSFDLYGAASLKRSIGSASYTCYFNYASNALCMAYYSFSGGTVVAKGLVDFNLKGFEMIITGGTKHFFAARGAITALPAPGNAQRVTFTLLT